MAPDIELEKLTDGSKSFLLSQAEKGIKPSEAIIYAIEGEARRKGFIVHLTTANKMSQPQKKNPQPKKPAA